MMVDLVPNREAYEDVYPPVSDEEDSDIDCPSDSDTGTDTIKSLHGECDKLRHSIMEADEEQDSAASRISILENYGKSIERDRPGDLEACLTAYRKERRKAWEVSRASQTRVTALEEERLEVITRIEKAEKAAAKEKVKAKKEKQKKIEKKRRAREEKSKAKRRLKEERAMFWPKKVHRVIVSFETNTNMTPTSSRRSSLDSVTMAAASESIPSDLCQISLSISYVTNSAYWAPRYDLNLNTPTNSGLIVYRAEFCNTTSETWKDAKVILSTSQTSFHGLGEPIPTLAPWHIRLSKGEVADNSNGALLSAREQEHKLKGHVANVQKASQPREALFGLEQFQGYQDFQQPRKKQVAPPMKRKMNQAFDDASDAELDNELELPLPSVPSPPSLATLETSWSESGLTTTYPLPRLLTIQPHSTPRRQRITSIALTHISLSHLLIPKYRPAAFLKARLQNTSSLTLLRGIGGVTLDGSYLGTTPLPRCAAGDFFSLSLGVDPAVQVIYPAPTVRRAQSGMFQKEGTAIYSRSCTVTNTKPHTAVQGVLLDQIPVSEDEKLKVEIVVPRGLKPGGDSVGCGAGLDKSGREEARVSGAAAWGMATAGCKRGGEVCWDFRIEAGRRARFELEYDARFPSGEGVVEV